MTKSWMKLLKPESVAIVGISGGNSTFQISGRGVLSHLVQHGFKGRVFPVNPKYNEIERFKCYPDLMSIPYDIDCAVISLPAKSVVKAIIEGIHKGIQAFIVISSGFAEAGEEGRLVQEQLQQVVEEHHVLILGPNTTGLVNFADNIVLSSTSRLHGQLPLKGSIGIISQSGALGSSFVDMAFDSNIGLSYLISTGNEIAIKLEEWIEFMVEDPQTQAIAVYAEGFKDPERLIKAAGKAFRAKKPIIIYKAGSSEMGKQVAVGHTGALAGSDEVQHALFKQLGIVRVEFPEDLLSTTAFLAHSPMIKGKRVGILSISGGLGGIITDVAIKYGLEIPSISEETRMKLTSYLPSYTILNNPIDIAGNGFGMDNLFGQCLEDIVKDSNYDMCIVACTPVLQEWAELIVKNVEEISKKTEKPIIVCWQSGSYCAEAISKLQKSRIPVFTSVRQCIVSICNAIKYDQYNPGFVDLIDNEFTFPQGLLVNLSKYQNNSILNELESKEFLEGFGLSTTREKLVSYDSWQQIEETAYEIGYPITLKCMVNGIIHKSDLGLVSVGLQSIDDLKEAYRLQLNNLNKHNLLDEVQGFLISETVKDFYEVIAGVKHDNLFGPVLTFGSGGIYTEILKDVALRVLPVSRREINSMIQECKITTILSGYRDKPEADIDALVDFLYDLSRVAYQFKGQIDEIDINPLAVLNKGKGIKVLDAVIRWRN